VAHASVTSRLARQFFVTAAYVLIAVWSIEYRAIWNGLQIVIDATLRIPLRNADLPGPRRLEISLPAMPICGGCALRPSFQ
jgi:hypothetical protein